MPIYEYACRSCGVKMEILQGINSSPSVECKECHQPTLERLVSLSSFRLKGGGWYETDFKKENEKKKNLVMNDESAPPVSVKPEGGEAASVSTHSVGSAAGSSVSSAGSKPKPKPEPAPEPAK